MEYFLSKICPGSWEREVHFSANIKTGSYTRQTTPQFRGGLLLDGQGEEDYTKDSVQNWGLAHRKNHKSNISRSSPVHSWFCWFRSHSSQCHPPSTHLYIKSRSFTQEKVFKICGIIRKSWQSFFLAYLCLIYYSVGCKQAQEFFKICGLIRKSRKLPEKHHGLSLSFNFWGKNSKKVCQIFSAASSYP